RPQSVFEAAQAAVKALGWTKPWHIDADHIRLETVDPFIPCSDFFTIDVADSIGRPAPPNLVKEFVQRHPELSGTVCIDGIQRPLELSPAEATRVATQYLLAVQEAGKI